MNTRDKKRSFIQMKSPPFVPRLPELQALNGKKFLSKTSIDLNQVPSFVKQLFFLNNWNLEEALETGFVGQKRLGKLLSNAYVPEKLISETYSAIIKPSELIFSTRYKDFLNCARSRYFKSCAGTSNTGTMLWYLSQSNVFVVLARDKHGGIQTRFIGRFMEVKNKPSFVFNRCYGIEVALPSTIFEYSCYIQSSNGFSITVKQPTIQNCHDDLYHNNYIIGC